jgi:hypothetical protein
MAVGTSERFFFSLFEQTSQSEHITESLCLPFGMVNLFDTFQTNLVINFHNKVCQTKSLFGICIKASTLCETQLYTISKTLSW